MHYCSDAGDGDGFPVAIDSNIFTIVVRVTFPFAVRHMRRRVIDGEAATYHGGNFFLQYYAQRGTFKYPVEVTKICPRTRPPRPPTHALIALRQCRGAMSGIAVISVFWFLSCGTPSAADRRSDVIRPRFLWPWAAMLGATR